MRSTILLLLILLHLHFVSFLSAQTNTVAHYWATCGNCLALSVKDGGVGYTGNDCSANLVDGVPGVGLIVRSSQIMPFVLSDVLTGGEDYMVGAKLMPGGTTLANLKFEWIDTGEIWWQDQAYVRFTPAIWEASQPNQAPVGSQPYAGCVTNNVLQDKPDNYVNRVVCLHEFDIVTSLTLKTLNATIGLTSDIKTFEAQLFPRHRSQNDAATQCRTNHRRTINGKVMLGALAILRTPQETQAFQDLLFHKSDIPLHDTTDTGYGVWLGAQVIDYTTGEIQWNVNDTRAERLHTGTGTCSGYSYCNFSSGFIPSVPMSTAYYQGVRMYANAMNPGWYLQDNYLWMPYGCTWHPDVTARLVTTSLSEDLTTSTTNHVYFAVTLVRQNQTNYTDAEYLCANGLDKLESPTGDFVYGRLATIFNAEEMHIMNQLTASVGLFNQSGDTTFAAWIGMSNNNAGGDIKYYGSFNNSYSGSQQPDVDFYDPTDNTKCAPGRYCSSVVFPVSLAQHVGATLTGSPNFGAAPQTQVRPFLCSFRLPVRRNLTNWLVAEYYSLPNSYDEASTACSKRSVGAHAHERLEGWLWEIPTNAYKFVNTFLGEVGKIGGPIVWSGGKFGNLCRVMNIYTGVWGLASCSHQYSYVCYFTTNKKKTWSKSFTASETHPSASASVSMEETRTNSSSETASESMSETPSSTPTKTDSVTMSNTYTVTTSQSSSLTITLSQTETDNLTRTNTITPPPTRTNTISKTIASDSPSFSGNVSLTATETPSITESQNISTSHSHTLTAPLTMSEPHSISHSETETILKIVKPVKVTTAREAVAVATTVVAAAMPAAGAALNRIAAAGRLAKCGESEIDDVEEAPDFLTSPTGLSIGQSDIRYFRGTLLGNFMVIVAVFFANLIVGGFIGVVFLGNFHEGTARTRFPSLAAIPLMILQPPTATATAVMFFFPFNGKDVVASITGGTFFLMVPIVVSIEVARRLHYKQCTLIPQDPNSKERKKQRRKWRKRITGPVYDGLLWLMMYKAEWRDTKVWEYEQDLKQRIENKDKAAKKELKKFNKEKNNEHSRYPFFGRWGEFFDDVSLGWFFVLDFFTSTVQGIAAGVAAKPVSMPICWTSFTMTILVSLAHFVVIAWKQPGMSRIYQFYLIVSSFLTLVIFILAFVKFIATTQFNFSDAENTLGVVQGVLGLVIGIVSLGEFFDFLHGLVTSLCCVDHAEDEKDSDDEEDDIKETPTVIDAAPALLAKEQEEEMKSKAQESKEQEEEEFEEEVVEEVDIMALARQAKAISDASGFGHDDFDDDDDDPVKKAARQRRTVYNIIREAAVHNPMLPPSMSQSKKKLEEEDAEKLEDLSKRPRFGSGRSRAASMRKEKRSSISEAAGKSASSSSKPKPPPDDDLDFL